MNESPGFGAWLLAPAKTSLVPVRVVAKKSFETKLTLPRGVRWAFLAWDFPGMKSAVHIDGVLNDKSQRGKGWTAMVVFPWAGMRHLAGGRSLPPRRGDMDEGRRRRMAVD